MYVKAGTFFMMSYLVHLKYWINWSDNSNFADSYFKWNFTATTLFSPTNLGDTSLRHCSSQTTDRCRGCGRPTTPPTSCRRVFLHKSHDPVCSLCKTSCCATSSVPRTSSPVCSTCQCLWSHHSRLVKLETKIRTFCHCSSSIQYSFTTRGE